MSKKRKRSTLVYKKLLWSQGQRQCHYCGYPLKFSDATLDHLIPKHSIPAGEPCTYIGNLVIACIECNHEKGAKSVEEFRHPAIQNNMKRNDKWITLGDFLQKNMA